MATKKSKEKKAPPAKKAPARSYSAIVEAVNNSESSVFSKDDVLRMLKEIGETSEGPGIRQHQVDDLITTICDRITEMDWDDLIDDYQLDMDGNYVKVTDASLGTAAIGDIVSEAVQDWAEEI